MAHFWQEICLCTHSHTTPTPHMVISPRPAPLWSMCCIRSKGTDAIIHKPTPLLSAPGRGHLAQQAVRLVFVNMCVCEDANEGDDGCPEWGPVCCIPSSLLHPSWFLVLFRCRFRSKFWFASINQHPFDSPDPIPSASFMHSLIFLACYFLVTIKTLIEWSRSLWGSRRTQRTWGWQETGLGVWHSNPLLITQNQFNTAAFHMELNQGQYCLKPK